MGFTSGLAGAKGVLRLATALWERSFENPGVLEGGTNVPQKITQLSSQLREEEELETAEDKA